jgi:hypothetical protein
MNLLAIIRNLRAASMVARAYDARNQQIDWTDTDSIYAARIFSHGTGKKLLLRLETGAVNMALDAISKGDKHSCGVAQGSVMQLEAIRQHISLGAAHSATSEESRQEAALDDFANSAAQTS